MNRYVKSIAYAFIANGVQVYFSDSDSDSDFIVTKLLCSDCGESWYMNLTECFICGSINTFLYKCQECGAFQSITKSVHKCNICGSTKLSMACANDECLSNTDKKLSAEINDYGGVFNKNSGFLISQQYCLNCGSQIHEYRSYRIKVEIMRRVGDRIDVNSLSDRIWTENTRLLVKMRNGNRILYGIYKLSELPNGHFDQQSMTYDFSEIVKRLYPVNSVSASPNSKV